MFFSGLYDHYYHFYLLIYLLHKEFREIGFTSFRLIILFIYLFIYFLFYFIFCRVSLQVSEP